MTNTAETVRTRRNRWALLALVAVAVMPLVAAYWLYRTGRGSEPWDTTNHGALIEPHSDLASLGLSPVEDAPRLGAERVWRLLTVTEGGCAEDCAAALHQIKQLHVLLNKDAPRVRRILVFVGPVPEGRIAELGERFPELAYARGSPGPLRDGVFIVDPLGNLVLYYRFDQAGRPVLDDLKRLLKVSQIG